MRRRIPLHVSLAFLVSLGVSPPAPRCAEPARIPEDLVRRFDELIPGLMRAQRIPGLALAITDEQGTLWSKGYGWTDRGRRQPVTPETIFSVQSISKTFTATAIMFACRDGLVDLDTPITDYLPDFKVNSVFEDHPERRITLRHLLSHTAGFTHEAPYGNNFNLDEMDFAEHIGSISRTWLRFPAGENYAYSNLGIDLAGHILQVRSGLPFAGYVREKILAPLGMNRSALETGRILQERDRAIGHTAPFLRVPALIPIIPSGGVYTSAEDLAKFVRFHLNGGSVPGATLLDRASLAPMYDIPPFAGGVTGGYALGVGRHVNHGTPGYGHSGGGFGFLADMYWYPKLGLGAVVLTNSANHKLQGDLVFRMLDALIDDPRTVYHQRLAGLPAIDPEKRIPTGDPAARLRADNTGRLAALALPADAARAAARRRYAGNYRYRLWGFRLGLIQLRLADGELYLADQYSVLPLFTAFKNGRRLYEIEPGLFFTADGEALDLRSQPPTWRNIRLER